VGNKNVWRVRLGHTRRGHTSKLSNDALGNIGKISRPLRHVPAHAFENLRKGRECLIGRALGVVTGFDSRLDISRDCGVSRHQSLGFEHCLRFSPHGSAPLRQPRGDTVESSPDAARLGFDITRAWRVRRRRERFRHAQNNTSRNA
jgi:hypothetical protein